MRSPLSALIGEKITVRCIRQPRLVYTGILSSNDKSRDNLLVLEQVTSTYHESPFDYLVIPFSEVVIEIDHRRHITSSDLEIGSDDGRKIPKLQRQPKSTLSDKRVQIDST